jgi:cbb3-type cytochrome c oxidase subunit I
MSEVVSIPRVDSDPVDKQLIRMHIYAALLWLGLGIVAGSLQAYRLTSTAGAELLADWSWLSFGRFRMVHTHTVIFGWLSNAFLAFAYYAASKLVGSKLMFERVVRGNFWLFQIALVLGTFGLMSGHAEGVEYAEAPFWADIPFALAFVIAGVSVVGTVLRSKQKGMYVSLWYIFLGFGFTALNFVVANTIVAHVAPGAAGAALSGLWIHNAVGLWITPMGIAIVYYLLPVILKKPIASHKLSLIGFWTLALFYPLGGSHHYFFSPVPWWLQVVAVPLTASLLFVVYSVVYNFFATMKGSWNLIAENMSLRFLAFGIFSYIFTCTQGPFQALLSVQKVVHFTDWVVAHAHLALFGVFSFWVYSFIYFIWPRISDREITFSKTLSEWHFWLTLLGFFVLYYVPDTIAGLMQGLAWLRGLPFSDSFTAAQPFWIPRAISGVVIAAGFFLFVINLLTATQREGKANAA